MPEDYAAAVTMHQVQEYGFSDDSVVERRNQHPASAATPSDTILVGTVDGVALLAKTERGWTVRHRALQGVFVSGVTALDDGTLFASTRGVGMARSTDGGIKWTWQNEGLAHHEYWSCRAGRLQAATWCSPARCLRIFTSARTRAIPGVS